MNEQRINARIDELEDKLEYHLRNSAVTVRKVFRCGAEESTFEIRLGGAGSIELFAPSGSVEAHADRIAFEYMGGGFYLGSAGKGEHAIRFSGTAAAIGVVIVGKGAAFI